MADTLLSGRPPWVSGEDGFRELEIAVAAENSYRQTRPCGVALEISATR